MSGRRGDHHAGLWVAACCLISCASGAPQQAAAVASAVAEPRPAADTAAPPFTATQIREATLAGRTFVFSVVADGAPPALQQLRFTVVDARGCVTQSVTLDAKGTSMDDVASHGATWDELVQHGTYPAAATTVEEVEVTVPAGTFAARKYTVRGDDGGVTTAWFAVELPGPPIRHVVTREGAVVSSSELVSHQPGG